MLNVSAKVRVFVCAQPADMRRSFDGLCGMVESIIEQDPLTGHLFVFRNRNRDRLKILYWDRDGFAIWYKHLQSGTWQLPVDLNSEVARSGGVEITSRELSLLLEGVELRSVRRRKRFEMPVEKT